MLRVQNVRDLSPSPKVDPGSAATLEDSVPGLLRTTKNVSGQPIVKTTAPIATYVQRQPMELIDHCVSGGCTMAAMADPAMINPSARPRRLRNQVETAREYATGERHVPMTPRRMNVP